MSVHYKFKSALEYDTVTFDGLHISVKDLKNSIVQQKRIGKNTDFDLQVTNAQTKEVYDDENALIPKNTSLLIARIPTSSQNKNKQWEGYGGDATPPTKSDEGGPIAKAVDLSSLDAPEDDKIKAMMSQSTQDYDPSNYMKIRGANQMGAVPPNYRCYKCHQMGHWIKDCPLSKGPEPIEIKKSTGIPLSFMVPVEGPLVQGAMMTPNGSYAVPVLDHQTYTQKPSAAPPVQEIKPDIPEDLVCSICSDLLTDAVMIPCCGNSFCDECIRSYLLDSEDHECPDCHEKDISPGTLIPNRFLRNSVANFKNTTGYVKKPVYKQARVIEETIEIKSSREPALTLQQTDSQLNKTEIEEKTIISEADSTEHSKNEEKEVDIKTSPKVEPEPAPEGPPGVSPEESPKGQAISKRINSSRERSSNSRPHKHRSREESPPRRHHVNRHTPPYPESGRNEDRPGTPTVDEPGVNSSSSNPPNPVYSSRDSRSNYAGSSGNMPPMMGVVPPMQGPPPSYQQPIGNFPPANGPPPNFRLPPPGGGGPPQYMAPGPYQVPPRAMFDAPRPPMTGPPPIYNPTFPPGRSHHRDFGNDRRMRGRTPSGVIDDPLAAFNRMLREKDERERRAKRNLRRSYSRSRSRSRSYSRSPRRLRSRSPRRRQSRSRSRSFSISRSRSRSFSGSPQFRNFSPRLSPPRRRGPSRYRSPVRSPPRHRFKPHGLDRFRERDYDHDREYVRERDDRAYSRDRDHHRRDDRDRDVHHDRERDRERDRDNREFGGGGGGGGSSYYDSAAAAAAFDDRNGRGKNPWAPGMPPRGAVPPIDAYYPPPEMQHQYSAANRYPPRDFPYKNEPPAHVMPQNQPFANRRFEDVPPPPGVEEPPVPGLENSPRAFDKFDRFPTPPREVVEEKRVEKVKEKEVEKRRRHEEKPRRTPARKSRSRDRETPEKHRKKKRDASPDRDHKKIQSDEDKSKKSKDKKKKKEKKESDKKKRKEKKDKHKDKKHKDEVKEVAQPQVEMMVSEKSENVEEHFSPEVREEQKPEPQRDLYDDMLTEDVDTKVVESYGKIKEPSEEKEIVQLKEEVRRFEERDFEDPEEKDILDLHPTDIDLKTELDVKNEMSALLPEKSKWEVDDETPSQTSPKEFGGSDSKSDKSGKVTNEVLKRAENAIFAKAINAIRPIEIKKISTDRAKLYSGETEEPEVNEEENKNSVTDDKNERKKVEPPSSQAPPRLSVKERLGVKVDELEKPTKVERNKSRSMSPFSRRTNEASRNYGMGERRVEIVDRRRRDRSRSRHTRRHRDIIRRDDYPSRRDRRDRQEESRKRDDKDKKRERSRSKTKHEEKRKRSRSRSESDDKKRAKRKEKKVKKEKTKTKHPEEEKQKEDTKTEDNSKTKTNTDKRKPTIDEASFEPDYDLESESEKEEAKKKLEEKKSSSSSESSDSSSDDDRKKKRHRKHKKKKSRRDSSSSSSESESESSDDDKEKKRKKHKKNKKKRKKSKHK